MNIDRVSADEGSANVSFDGARAGVPHLDVLVPTTRYDYIFVFFRKLRAKDTQTVTRLSISSIDQAQLLLTCLLVVKSYVVIRATSKELKAVRFVVACQQLIVLVVNSIQTLATGRVPVIETAIGIRRNYNVFGYSGCI